MAHAHDLGLIRLDEPFQRVLADGLEQPVASRGATFLGHHERLFDERAEQVEDPVGGQPVARGHRVDGVQSEAAGKNARSTKQHPRVGVE